MWERKLKITNKHTHRHRKQHGGYRKRKAVGAGGGEEGGKGVNYTVREGD